LTSETRTVRKRLEAFERERPRYERLEHVLRDVVERLAHESVSHASIYAHTATRAEVADRLHREGPDAALDPGTICTVTVVVYLPNEKRDLYLILKSFLGLQGATHPQPGEDFNTARLLPLRYTARIDGRSAARLSTLGVSVPPDVLGLSAVLEFRTLFEHLTLRLRGEIDAPGGETPRWIERKLLEFEGFVRDAQLLLVPIHEDLRRWAGSYGNYISEEDARRQLEVDQQTLAIVSDVKIATRASKLAMILGDWSLVIAILTPYEDLKNARVLRDLGAALCKKHAPEDGGYQIGLAYLEQACRLAPNDPDTFARLAGAYRRLKDIPRARTAYERALEVDPGNPYALSGFLHTTLMLDPQSGVIAEMKGAIQAAVGRCRDRVAAGTDMPWALLDHGKFLLLQGKDREGLEAYAKAIGRTTAPWMLETTVRSLTELGQYASVPRAFAMAVHLLVLGWCARFRSEEAARQLTKRAKMRRDLEGPVVFLVEAADAPSAAHAARLAGLLNDGLDAFAGTVLLVGRHGWIAPMLAARSSKALVGGARILDYGGPGAGSNASTEGELGATLASWGDVVGSGVPGKNVIVLFLGDDRRAAVDRELAAAVGARVGMVPVDEEDDGEPEAEWGGTGDDNVSVLRDAKAIAALVADRA
jgi:tetratricopeptide (TPR) repeat protein